MTDHILTKTYDGLRGFSTDSKFVRPANVSDKAINMVRLPDGTFSPRRGYQVQIDDVGGLGMSTYEDLSTGQNLPVCISRDGNLYVQQSGSMTISFSDPNSNPASYITYEIYVDPSLVSDNQTCDFDPYLSVDDTALVDDCMKFRAKQKLAYASVAIGSGSATYSGTLSGAPITPGTIYMTDGTLSLSDDSLGGFDGDTGVGTNTINYTTGAYTVTLSGATGALVADYSSTLQSQFNQCLGKGFLEASPYSVADIITDLGAITGVTVVSSGNTNYPAAFLDITEETIIPHGKSATLVWYYWENANRTVASTFSGIAAKINSDDLINASFAAYENDLYIATPFDAVHKYDGQTVYKAGMPEGTAPGLAVVASGTGIDAGDHTYFVSHEQVDATGRIVEGVVSDTTTITVGANEDVNVTVTNLLQGSGWNTNCAIVNGAGQTNVNTITVDDGSGGPHTLSVGDTAYFYDSVEGDYVTREVTANTASTITVAGNAVTVADNAVISNNLRINIYRTKAGLTEPGYEVVSIPNNSYASTQVYLDQILDANLGTQYTAPERASDPPPSNVGVVIPYANLLVFTDDRNNDDLVWFSEPNNPEYVSASSNGFIVPSNDDDVTGAGVAGSTLIIFKEKSIYAVSGDLVNNQFTVESVSSGANIGAVSHHTIAQVGQLLYFLHTNGVYTLAETEIFPTDKFGNPVPISIMIDQIFREDPFEADHRLIGRRATAINYSKDNQYLLFLPAEDVAAPKGANLNSRVLCYDYQGKNWFEWTRVNAAGGWYVQDDDLFWQERLVKNNTITAKKYKQHRKYRLIDQVDHVTPIRVTFESSWEDMGQPRVRKKFVRTVLLFDEISAIFQENIPTMCFYTYRDWVDGRISTSADVMQKIQSKAWSTDSWSWLAWSGYQDSFITIASKGGTVSKSMKIGLRLNTINTSFRLQGFQLEVAKDFGRTIVR